MRKDKHERGKFRIFKIHMSFQKKKTKTKNKKNNRISNSKELLELKSSLKMELKGTPNI